MEPTYDFSQGKRGPLPKALPERIVPLTPNKTRITIRLDDDILNWFRQQVHLAGGGNYQTLINEVLRNYIDQTQPDREPLEDTLRRIVREELQRVN
jgi:uncharacterized protein (DUF4415 family)